MKKAILLGIMLGLAAPAAFATDAAPKIGILDAEKIMHNAPQIATINKSLEKQFRPEHDKLMKEQQALQADIQKLNRDNATMTDRDRSALQDKIIAAKNRLRSEEEGFQQNINSAQDQAMGKFMETLKGVINKIAGDQHYDLVLLKQATAYSNSKFEITDQVLDALNKK